jgi:hypothetical protein
MSQGTYGNAVALINRSEQVMCQQQPLPIDLVVRRGASRETDRRGAGGVVERSCAAACVC